MDWLERFVAESNGIEGIIRDPTPAEIEATRVFLESSVMTVDELCGLVGVYQPNAIFRDRMGVPGVRVGAHIAPPSGPAIREDLNYLLRKINGHCIGPYDAHREYETMHPFTDGNGRSGRALWLWMMYEGNLNRAQHLGFLHTWYYQSLESKR